MILAARQWCDANSDKKGMICDEGDINQLLVLSNMESYNAILHEQGKMQSERLILLRDLAMKQMQTMVALNYEWITTIFGRFKIVNSVRW